MLSKEKEVPLQQAERQYVAELMLKVLEGEYSVREALEKFPRNIKDISVQCAWHALIHYEADEELRQKDSEYAEEQDYYLNSILLILQKGESLPENILQEYNKYYGTVVYTETQNIFSKLKSIFRFII